MLTSRSVRNAYLSLDAADDNDVAAAPLNHGGQESCKDNNSASRGHSFLQLLTLKEFAFKLGLGSTKYRLSKG